MSASENARTPERRSAIGSRLRANRTMRHLTLRELARRVGVSPSLISQIETGRSQPSVGTLYAIATELEVSVDDLLFDGDDNTRSERRPGSLGARDDQAAAAAGPVQRSHNRRAISLDSGVRWERLTTQHDDDVEFLDVVYDVGGAHRASSSAAASASRSSSRSTSWRPATRSPSPRRHRLQRRRHPGPSASSAGRLPVTPSPARTTPWRLARRRADLPSGPPSWLTTPHRLANVGDVPVHAIWCVVGRDASPKV